jgi:hypothetical protein
MAIELQPSAPTKSDKKAKADNLAAEDAEQPQLVSPNTKQCLTKLRCNKRLPKQHLTNYLL